MVVSFLPLLRPDTLLLTLVTHLDHKVEIALVLLVIRHGRVGPDHWLAVLPCVKNVFDAKLV